MDNFELANAALNEQQSNEILEALKKLLNDRPFVCLVLTNPTSRGFAMNDFSNVGQEGAYTFCKSFVDAYESNSIHPPRNDN